jgi:hypothetical protein
MSAVRFCQRNVRGKPCAEGPDGGPAVAVGSADGRWYCDIHLPAYRAWAKKHEGKFASEPFAPKYTGLYLAIVPDLRWVKVGKASTAKPGKARLDRGLMARVRAAATEAHRTPDACDPWATMPFTDRVPWSDSQRVEHAVAGKLAVNIDAVSVENKPPHRGRSSSAVARHAISS